MKDKFETIPFQDTPEKHAALDKILDEYRDVPGGLVQALKKAQDVYGYLPLEVQIMVAEGLSVPLEEVYGVVTFYSFFTTQPKGKYEISVCLGTACYVKGSGAVFNRLCERLGIQSGGCTKDGQFSLQACRCIGACGLAPVLMIKSQENPTGKVYGSLTVDDVDKIIAEYQNA